LLPYPINTIGCIKWINGMLKTLQCTSVCMNNDGAFKKLSSATCLLLFLTVAGIPVADAATSTLTVGATVISKNNCRFRSGPATLNFGNLDPGNAIDITQTASMQFRCQGSAPMATFAFATDDGLYETGPGANRMRNTTTVTEYLPYSLSLSPASGTVPKGVEQTLTVTGTVTSSNYRSAYAGNYSDTVVISLTP
jgi:spore coat protein U-like protein